MLKAAVTHDGVMYAESKSGLREDLDFSVLLPWVSMLSCKLSAQSAVELLQLAAHYL